MSKKYGIEVFDFSDGVDVPDETIQKWVDIAEGAMKRSEKENDSYRISSGNTVVCAAKFGNRIETIISKNFVQKTSFIEDAPDVKEKYIYY